MQMTVKVLPGASAAAIHHEAQALAWWPAPGAAAPGSAAERASEAEASICLSFLSSAFFWVLPGASVVATHREAQVHAWWPAPASATRGIAACAAVLAPDSILFWRQTIFPKIPSGCENLTCRQRSSHTSGGTSSRMVASSRHRDLCCSWGVRLPKYQSGYCKTGS